MLENKEGCRNARNPLPGHGSKLRSWLVLQPSNKYNPYEYDYFEYEKYIWSNILSKHINVYIKDKNRMKLVWRVEKFNYTT